MFNSRCVACWWFLSDLTSYIMRCYLLKRPFLAYCWWKKSCTTSLAWSPVNDGTFRISTGPGFGPSTVCSDVSISNPCKKQILVHCIWWLFEPLLVVEFRSMVSKILLLTLIPREMIGCGWYSFQLGWKLPPTWRFTMIWFWWWWWWWWWHWWWWFDDHDDLDDYDDITCITSPSMLVSQELQKQFTEKQQPFLDARSEWL